MQRQQLAELLSDAHSAHVSVLSLRLCSCVLSQFPSIQPALQAATARVGEEHRR